MNSDKSHFAGSEDEVAYYNKFIQDILDGVVVSEEQLEHHVALQNRAIRSGLHIGEQCPDFALPDQFGNVRNWRELVGSNGIVIVFSRTVNWCPYCRDHLLEVELARPLLAEKGVTIVAITPDLVDLHSQYAAMAGIDYLLLSDADRSTIKAFDILNENIPANVVAQHPDVPFPGYFLIDSSGTIIDKGFLGDYQFRQSPTVAVMRAFGPFVGSTIVTNGSAFSASVSLSSGKCCAGHQLGLRCVVHPLQPFSERRLPLEISLQVEGAVLAETVNVQQSLTGITDQSSLMIDTVLSIRWSAPLVFDNVKGLEKLVLDRLDPGKYTLTGKISISQEAEDGPPEIENLNFELEIEIAQSVPQLAQAK